MCVRLAGCFNIAALEAKELTRKGTEVRYLFKTQIFEGKNSFAGLIIGFCGGLVLALGISDSHPPSCKQPTSVYRLQRKVLEAADY